MESAIVLAALAAVSTKFVDFAKYVANGDRNGVLTQLFAWFVSIVAVMAFIKAGFLDGVKLPLSELPVSQYGTVGQVLAGLIPGSAGGIFIDAKKAIDNTDSAAMKSLFVD